MTQRNTVEPAILKVLGERLLDVVSALPVCDDLGVVVGPYGLRPVLTPSLEHVLLYTPQLLEHRRIMLLDGRAGVGKSAATRLFTATAASSVTRVARVGVLRAWTPMQFQTQLLRAVDPTADIPNRGWRIDDKIVARLSQHDVVVVIDDAHRLTLRWMEHLSSLWDEADQCPMLICGIGVGAVIDTSEELCTRVEEREYMRPATGLELLTTLAALHPLLAHLTVGQVLRTDHCLAHTPYGAGRLRSWINIFNKLVTRPHNGSVSDEDLLAALTRISKIDLSEVWSSW